MLVANGSPGLRQALNDISIMVDGTSRDVQVEDPEVMDSQPTDPPGMQLH